MSDEPPGLNSPRRKSRFRSQYDDGGYRRPQRQVPAGETGAPMEAEPLPEGEENLAADESAPPLAAASGPADDPPAEEAEASGQEDGLLPNFRLNKVYEPPPARSGPLKDWRWLLVTATLLSLGLAGGYCLGLNNAPPTAPKFKAGKGAEKQVANALAPEVQAQVDAAFDATKHTQYQEAHDRFAVLYKDHPEWWSMGIETARTSLYLHDAQGAQRALREVSAIEALPDADFIMALLHLTNKEMDLAETSFATAVARDPARPDFYYFWGEALRRDGKPREAVEKFRSALLRNQYENAEGLYRLKYWLSQIQADAEESGGANKEINAGLAADHPPYEALFAAAAREMKARRYPEAIKLITRARALTEPSVFRVIMEDPTFTEEAGTHAEFAPFYR